MIELRRSGDRGHAEHGWLSTKHTFSFANYRDPDHMGFRSLRVINEDIVVPGEGFGRHPHRDMEIISYVVEGALEHKDSMGNGSVIRPGELQRMTAGTGVAHSEYNHSQEEPVRFLQIWITPAERGLTPGYEQRDFRDTRINRLRLVASSDGRDGSLQVHQDVNLYASVAEAGQELHLDMAPGRFAWIQLVRGSVVVHDEALHAGDGAALSGVREIGLRVQEEAELLLFDLA